MKMHQLTSSRSIIKEVERRLNAQIAAEGGASSRYLAMASWADTKGYEGAARFLYAHAEEEREHMLKIVHYVNEAGGFAESPEIQNIPHEFKSLHHVFESVLKHEILVSEKINDIYDYCLQVKDFTTAEFLTWYVREQREEEEVARRMLSFFDLIGTKDTGLYLIDKAIGKLADHDKND